MRISLRTSATVIAGAALLALGANGVSYAATGEGLIGGHQNVAGKTTTLKTSGPGPTLSLVTQGDRRPSLAVSSKAKVKNLNASMLAGRTAASLGTTATTFVAGRAGASLEDVNAFRLAVEPGVYALSFQGAFEPVEETETGSVQCLVVDGHLHLYAGATSPFDADAAPLPSASNVVRIPRGSSVIAACFASAPATFLQPLSVSFTKIDDQTVKHAHEIAATMLRHAIAPRI